MSNQEAAVAAPGGGKARPRQRDTQIMIALLISAGIGVFGVVVYGLQFRDHRTLSVASVGVVVAGAAFAIGGFFGFLFGSPKALESAAREGNTSGYQSNTNLEQISDWLTKILVGVGLTQIANIPPEMGRLVDYLSPGLGNEASTESFVLALLLYFLVGGFLIGYLWTRFYMKGLLEQADLREELTRVTQKVEQAERRTSDMHEAQTAQKECDVEALTLVETQLGGGGVAQEELVAAIAAASPVVREQILMRAGNQRSMNWRRDKPTMARTIPVFQALISVDDASPVSHRYHGQLGYALKDQESPDWDGALGELSRAIESRGPWQEHGWLFYEFNRAVAVIGRERSEGQEGASPAEVRESVVADLGAACTDAYVGELIKRNEGGVLDWLSRNQLSLQDLGV